jgi:tRNA dimethylallyltransferase
MLENGLIDEIRELYKMHLPQIFPAMRACGLREFIEYLNGNVSLEQATSSAQQATRHYVKRQFTWFRHQINYASPASFSTKTD